jgi:hypothetical protein
MSRSISSKLFVIASGEANVYVSSYYWNFRTSSFKQVACLILSEMFAFLACLSKHLFLFLEKNVWVHIRFKKYLLLLT